MIRLDFSSLVLLIHGNIFLYAVGLFSDLETCKTNIKTCIFDLRSVYLPYPCVVGGVCETVLTQTDAFKALQFCPYHHNISGLIFHL